MRISDYNCKYFGTNEALAAFLSDVRKYPVPTAEEEQKLIIEFKSGNEESGQKLILGHLRFIYALAKIYTRNENEVLDYVNEGVIGFKKGIEEFNINSGNKLITYAVWYIRRQMNYYLNDTRNLINRSNNNKIGKKIDILKQKKYAETGIEPSIDELKSLFKEHYNIEIKEDCDLYDVNISSINEEIDDNYTVEDESEYNNRTSVVNDYENTAEIEYKKAIVSTVLSMIPEKQSDMIKMLYGIDYDRIYSTQEVGDKYSIKDVEVASLRDKIFKYLRQNLVEINKRAI